MIFYGKLLFKEPSISTSPHHSSRLRPEKDKFWPKNFVLWIFLKIPIYLHFPLKYVCAHASNSDWYFCQALPKSVILSRPSTPVGKHILDTASMAILAAVNHVEHGASSSNFLSVRTYTIFLAAVCHDVERTTPSSKFFLEAYRVNQ
mgnify:CR=1 FL=1